MELKIEISGDQVACRQDGDQVLSVPLADFLNALGSRADQQVLPEAVPDGVRFVRRRGASTVLVMEERPQVRTVRWLTDKSPVPFGEKAVYRTARLAFPFVVVVVTLRGGGMTGHQECFYRTAPLENLSDPLLLPNLPNVANGHGHQCWLCLAGMKDDLSALPWGAKVRAIRQHMWGAGFNRSSEVHEGNSYWQTSKELDPRLAKVEAWEEASGKQPFFPLEVAWRPSERTVGQVMDEMLVLSAAAPAPASAEHLVQMLMGPRRKPSIRKLMEAGFS